MLRIFAFAATVAAAASMAGTASAHPPDLYSSTYGGGYTTSYPSYVAPRYDTTYAQPTYTQPNYAQPTYAQPSYSQPVYTQPSHGNTYAAPTYATPAYAAPTYSRTSYGRAAYDATPLYSKTYATPPRLSFTGYRSPSYGYRHAARGHHGSYPTYDAYSSVPSHGALNYGYTSVPTYGSNAGY